MKDDVAQNTTGGGGVRSTSMSQHSWWRSVGFAIDGLVDTVAEQRNMRIHVLCGVLVSQVGLCLPWRFAEQAILLGCVAAVLCAELFNSSLEHVVDLASTSRTEAGRRAKDSAAAAVLVLSLAIATIFALLVVQRADTVFADIWVIQRQVVIGLVTTIGAGASLHPRRTIRVIGVTAAVIGWAVCWGWVRTPIFQGLSLALIGLAAFSGSRTNKA